MAAPSGDGGDSPLVSFFYRLVGVPRKGPAPPPTRDELIVQLHARHHETERLLEKTHRPQLRECARRIAEYKKEINAKTIPPAMVAAFRNAHRLVCSVQNLLMLVDDSYLAIVTSEVMRDATDTIHLTTTALRREAEGESGLNSDRIEELVANYEDQLRDLGEVQQELDEMVSRASDTGFVQAVADTTEFDEKFQISEAELATIEAVVAAPEPLREADFPQVPRQQPPRPPVPAAVPAAQRERTAALTS